MNALLNQSECGSKPFSRLRPKLFVNSQSGHSYKAALMLSLAHIPVDLKHIDLSISHSDRPAEFRHVSLFGEVPVLQYDEVTLCQSNAILCHLAERSGLLDGRDAGERLRVREWMSWEANRIGFSLPNLRFQLKFADFPKEDVLEFLRRRAIVDLTTLDEHLRSSAFLVSDQPTIADITCCGYLFWLGEASLEVNQWPAVGTWLHRLSTLPGWRHPDDLLRHPG